MDVGVGNQLRCGVFRCTVTLMLIAYAAAFDPAGPGFENLPRLVRLNKESATFVDVLHTNAKPVTALGFGMMHAIGRCERGGSEEHQTFPPR